jgi:hypothetical protein
VGGDARITGRISIAPPITWGELHDKPWAHQSGNGHYPDVVVNLTTTKETTPDGEVFHHAGTEIITTGHETSAYHLLDELNRIVTTFDATPDGTRRTFTGFFHVVWAHGDEVYRVVIRDGRAVEVKPQIVWPEGARDEDAAGGVL